MADVDLAEIIPAYNSSEGEEQHTDRHEDFSEGSIGRIKSALRQGGSGQAVVPYAGGKNYKGSERKDDKGIDKYAHHSDNTLICRMLHIGSSVGVGRGAHAGLIGKQTSGNAVAHGFLHGYAQHSAGNGAGRKGSHKNILKCLRNAGKMRK